MALKLHNTLTKQVDEFVSQSPNLVKLYTCGPTVYSYLHVGNWAAYIYWDTLVRTLEANDYQVDRVMNITDVGHLVSDEDEGEDKMQKGARREGKTAWEVAQFYGDDFLHGMKRLNLIEPQHITKATEYIEQQLALVRVLKEKGYTYQIDDGIYFDTKQFPSYATFAGLDLEAQRAGARVEYNDEKHHPSDFALWKFSPKGEHRDMEWSTPTDLLEGSEGKKGFPGWHLECSAMAMSILGDTLDIHTGGIDHIPVHHTNEIAQSEAATGVRFSNYWLHNNHLTVDGTKISKSLDNGFTLDDIEARGYSALDYRLFVLQSSYRNESNFTFENLTAAKHRLSNWRAIAALRHQIHDTLEDDDDKGENDAVLTLYASSGAIIEALNDDLNTPEALKIIDDIFNRLASRNIETIHRHSLIQLLETIDSVLGLNLLVSTPDITDTMKLLIIERERARDDKDWVRSDELRDQLFAQRILVRDTSNGSVWSYQD